MLSISLLVLALLAFSATCFAATRKVIIDTDPGTDDAMAIILAQEPKTGEHPALLLQIRNP